MSDAFLLTVCATFLFAGTIKGVVGLGLPTVSLGILTAAYGLTDAMVLMVVPSALTNIWQALSGGHLGMLLRRFWPFLLPATLAVPVGAMGLNLFDLNLLAALLGLLIVLYAGLALGGFHPRPATATGPMTRLGPAAGLVNGLMGGLTGSFTVPGVLYLTSSNLTRDQLVQAMGILFCLSTLGLAAGLGQQGFVTTDLGLASMLGVVPACIGMYLGQKLRRRLDETLFRRIFLISLLLMGLYILATAISAYFTG